MDINKQPGIEFNGIILVRESFWRDKNLKENIKFDIEFDFNIAKTPDSIDFNLSMTTKCKGLNENDEKEVIKLEVEFVGLFQYISGQENMNSDDFIKNSAPAIMFPYIREHISMITQKAGITPFYLAPINFIALLRNTDI